MHAISTLKLVRMLLGAKHVGGRVGVEEVYLVGVCRMLTIETRCAGNFDQRKPACIYFTLVK